MRRWMCGCSMLAVVVGWLGGVAANGECPTLWSARGGGYIPDGSNFEAITVWNDGRRDQLILAGRFAGIGAVRTSGIAAWNGRDWRPLGEGLGDAGATEMTALTTYQGELIASGRFTRSGAQPLRRIARWDGVQWRPMGQSRVLASDFTIHHGDLIAGGEVGAPGGPHFVASCGRWNGAEWEPIGERFEDREVWTITSHAGQLIVAGSDFLSPQTPFIFAWNGAAWTELPGSDGLFFMDIESFNGELVAAVEEAFADYPKWSTVMRWVGDRWDPVGSPIYGDAWKLSRYQGQLVVVGQHESPAPNRQPTVVLRWDGASWEPGVSPSTGVSTRLAVEYQGKLVVAGSFAAMMPDSPEGLVTNLATTDFESWSALGTHTDNRIADLTNFNGQIIAGGEFSLIESVLARGLAAWDGREWREFAGGLAGSASALRVEGDDLIVAGQFEIPGVAGARNIAIWRDGGWLALGAGLSGPADAMTRFHGELIVGGQFISAGSQPMNFIARWDGAAWLPLGNGLSGQATSMAVLDDGLYVGGFFGRAGDRLVSNLARWDGARWEVVGAGANEGVTGGGTASDSTGVYALATFDGELYVGGTFATAGGIESANLARWDGSAWHAGPAANGSVRALDVIDGVLHVGGRFTNIGGVTAIDAATWDGTHCEQIGEGLATTLNAFSQRGNRLMAAGSLFLSNDSASPAAFTVAEFGCLYAVADLNCDTVLTIDDIGPFVVALTDPTAYAAAYPDCTIDNADSNGDGVVTVGDIGAFVALLLD
ncbi:MAG: hypothetical protein SF069_10360 [Phycisphaerae bacterium]|nr:hypothetical protein [Phycisphaerae bacterium]